MRNERENLMNLSDPDDRWESSDLGCVEGNIRRATPKEEREIKDALGVVEFPVRLNTETAAKFREIAKQHGVNELAIMRGLVEDFVECQSHYLMPLPQSCKL